MAPCGNVGHTTGMPSCVEAGLSSGMTSCGEAGHSSGMPPCSAGHSSGAASCSEGGHTNGMLPSSEAGHSPVVASCGEEGHSFEVASCGEAGHTTGLPPSESGAAEGDPSRCTDGMVPPWEASPVSAAVSESRLGEPDCLGGDRMSEIGIGSDCFSEGRAGVWWFSADEEGSGSESEGEGARSSEGSVAG